MIGDYGLVLIKLTSEWAKHIYNDQLEQAIVIGAKLYASFCCDLHNR